MNKKTVVGAGVGLAAFAAGAHFLYGKEGAKNREKVKGWTLKARGEILEKIETLREINEQKYHDVVDSVASRYKKLKKVDTKELNNLVKQAKGVWSKILKKVPGRHVVNGDPDLKTKRKKAAKSTKARRATAGRAKKA